MPKTCATSLVWLALLAAPAAPAVANQSATIEATKAFQAFEEYCLDTTTWGSEPKLQAITKDEISPMEALATENIEAGYRFYLVSSSPRTLLALRWIEEDALVEGSSRIATSVDGNCVIITREHKWDGVVDALERLLEQEARSGQNMGNGTALFLKVDSNPLETGIPRIYSATENGEMVMYRARL